MVLPSDSELREIVQKVVSRTVKEGASPPHSPVPKREKPRTPTGSDPERKTVALGADHGGYPLKQTLKAYLEEQGYAIVDCGTHSTDAVDYPDYARAVAQLVSENKVWRGIVIDGAGIGSCMVANKVTGVRASMCYDHATANNAREHNNANVLTLGAGLVGASLAKQIALTWLTTPFAGGRHARRVDKINALDIDS